MRRSSWLSVVSSALAVSVLYACSSSEGGESSSGGSSGGSSGNASSSGASGTSGETSSSGGSSGASSSSSGGSSGASSSSSSGSSSGEVNPLTGVGVPKLIVDGSGGASAFIDGIQWGGSVLYFSDVNAGTNSNGVVVEYDPAKYNAANLALAVSPYRNPSNKIVGMGLDKTGQLIGCSVMDADNKPLGRVVKIAKTGAYTSVATTNANLLISPNDLVVRKSDNTIYVTDPAYQNPDATKNYVWRIDPTGKVNTLKEFDMLDRPNGIGMTKDESLLYVSFTAPQGGPKAFVGRYKLKADGTVTDDGKLTEFADAGAFPDGLTVDDAGNVYVAVATGVDVFKPGGQKWGTINVTPRPNNVRFGGADKKSLFITTVQKVFEVKVAVAGRTD